LREKTRKDRIVDCRPKNIVNSRPDLLLMNNAG
jgi:hypothetical protein